MGLESGRRCAMSWLELRGSLGSSSTTERDAPVFSLLRKAGTAGDLPRLSLSQLGFFSHHSSGRMAGVVDSAVPGTDRRSAESSITSCLATISRYRFSSEEASLPLLVFLFGSLQAGVVELLPAEPPSVRQLLLSRVLYVSPLPSPFVLARCRFHSLRMLC